LLDFLMKITGYFFRFYEIRNDIIWDLVYFLECFYQFSIVGLDSL